MAMHEILAKLVNNAKVECEEQQRLVVMARNGRAAIALLEDKPAESAKLYRETLAMLKAAGSLIYSTIVLFIR